MCREKKTKKEKRNYRQNLEITSTKFKLLDCQRKKT